MAAPYVYVMRLPATAFTAARSMIQVATSANAAADILEMCLYQTTKTSASELWQLQTLRKSAGATVTAATTGTGNTATLVQSNPADPAPLLTLSTTATGYNATGEGTDGNIGPEYGWNILNGMWIMTDIPEGRLWIPKSGFWALKLNTAPAASTTVGGYLKIREYQ